jgi:hypothetical protein
MRRTLNMEADRKMFATELRDLSGQRIGEVQLSRNQPEKDKPSFHLMANATGSSHPISIDRQPATTT